MQFKLTIGPSHEHRRVYLNDVDVSSLVHRVHLVSTSEGCHAIIELVATIEGVVEGEATSILARLPVEGEPDLGGG